MTISNSIEGMTEAHNAGKAWANAATQDGKGDALAIYALVTLWHDWEGAYTVDDEAHSFTLATYGNPLFNATGNKDNKRTNARTIALATQLFGLPLDEKGKLENRFASRINRAYQAARYLVAQNAAIDLKKGNLVVPFTLIEEAPGEKASEKEKAMYSAMANQNAPMTLDGRSGMSLANLGKRADAWAEQQGNGKAKRGTKSKSDKGLSFDDAINFALRVVKDWNNPDNAESDVAPTPAIRATLFNLSEQLAAYFAADPLASNERKNA